MPEPELLIVAATEREAAPFREQGFSTTIAGVGKVNAAVAASLALTGRKDATALVSVGIAGSLPGEHALRIGDVVVGAASVSAEDGVATPDGFQPLDEMGFPLARGVRSGRFASDSALLARMRRALPDAVYGDIATVSTCSGTDEAAEEVVRRTQAIAEAMEGVGVLQAAAQLGAPAIEIRTISNTTGRRDAQTWNLELAFEALGRVAAALLRP